MKIHPTADIQSKEIGEGTTIWQFVVILPGAKVGINCNVCSHVFIENKVVVGDNVTIKNGVHIYDNVEIADDVFIGPSVTFTNDLVPRSKKYPAEYLKTKIGHHASVGANSTIIGGVTIGEYALIGAGSVITKNIAPFAVYYGNPARHKGYITREGVLLNLNLEDEQGCCYSFMNGEPLKMSE